jgi:hypothetical protein
MSSTDLSFPARTLKSGPLPARHSNLRLGIITAGTAGDEDRCVTTLHHGAEVLDRTVPDHLDEVGADVGLDPAVQREHVGRNVFLALGLQRGAWLDDDADADRIRLDLPRSVLQPDAGAIYSGKGNPSTGCDELARCTVPYPGHSRLNNDGCRSPGTSHLPTGRIRS